tara:strand:- start:22 stop:174 length:153 start_codon:yes stop_codon:yes gene_type:complete
MENGENKNKTPYKMARLAWPKAKYGLIFAVIMIVIISLIYYKDAIFSLFK